MIDFEIDEIIEQAFYIDGQKVFDLGDTDPTLDDEDATQSYYIGKDVCPHFDY